MICVPMFEEGRTVIACGPRRFKDAPHCLTFGCLNLATRLCDAPATEREGTCDKPMCHEHAHPQGDGTDLCEPHEAVWTANRAGVKALAGEKC